MYKIRVRVMCLFQHEGKALVCKYFNEHAQQYFYFLLGGGVEFGETTEAALQREMTEELGTTVENPQLLDVFENLFDYDGRPHHEICFLYSGTLANKQLIGQPTLTITEGNDQLLGVWVPITELLDGPLALYPTYDYRKYLLSPTKA